MTKHDRSRLPIRPAEDARRPEQRVMKGLGIASSFSTRAMTDEDLTAVLEIESASFAIPWSPRMFLSELRHELSWTRVLVEQEGALAGYIICRFHGDLWHIMDVAIRPDLRGRGLGAALLDEFLEVSAGSAAEYSLEVRPSNGPALSLYRSRGFEVVGRRPGYYHDNREDALVMVRSPLGSQPDGPGSGKGRGES